MTKYGHQRKKTGTKSIDDEAFFQQGRPDMLKNASVKTEDVQKKSEVDDHLIRRWPDRIHFTKGASPLENWLEEKWMLNNNGGANLI